MTISLLISFFITMVDAQTAGTLEYNSSNSRFEYYNGTEWKSMDNGTTGVSCSAAGTLEYNTSNSRFEFCNGAEWHTMIGGGGSVGGCSNNGEIQYNSTSNKYEGCAGGSVEELEEVAASPCGASPSVGDSCTGGGVYAGTWNSTEYMVTPGGCTDSTTPTCAGGSDTVTKTWATSTPYDPGAESYSDIATQSTVTGDTNTTNIVSFTGGDPYNAAKYCDDMDYGGYTDWYLPAKSELAFILCNSNRSSSFGGGYPDDSPGCADYGTSTGITGVVSGCYWSSTQAGGAEYESFTNCTWVGAQYSDGRENANYVRCIRKL